MSPKGETVMQRSERLGKEKLNKLATAFFGKPVSLEWGLMWLHNRGQSAPTWRDFANVTESIRAIAPIRHKERTYWLAYQPPGKMTWDVLLTRGPVAALAQTADGWCLWLNDPRKLKDSPSNYSPDSPEGRRYSVRSLAALRDVIGE